LFGLKDDAEFQPTLRRNENFSKLFCPSFYVFYAYLNQANLFSDEIVHDVLFREKLSNSRVGKAEVLRIERN
jgi:hypothetical protein